MVEKREHPVDVALGQSSSPYQNSTQAIAANGMFMLLAGKGRSSELMMNLTGNLTNSSILL